MHITIVSYIYGLYPLFLAICSIESSVHFFFFLNDTPPTEIYTLSLHDALPIFVRGLTRVRPRTGLEETVLIRGARSRSRRARPRSEEHTSELQSLAYLVCRLLLETKKKNTHKLNYKHTNHARSNSAITHVNQLY